MSGLYIHIPFCRKICAYCDFYRAAYSPDLAKKYPAALYDDAVDFFQTFPSAPRLFDSVYIGGGTPTVLPEGMLADALGMLKTLVTIEEGAEVSCEGNPESFTDKRRKS